MRNQGYSREFKDEAVRWVVDRGYSVPEVTDPLGVSSHSLYKWVKALKPDNSEQQAVVLIEAKSEILKLLTRLKRTEEERDIPRKGRKVLCQRARVKYRFINDHRHEFPVASMCRVLQAPRSGYYKWLHKPLSDRAIDDQRLPGLIRASYAASSGVCGPPRIFLDLREVGETCGRNRGARIIREKRNVTVRGYQAPRRIVGRPSIVAPNRLQ